MSFIGALVRLRVYIATCVGRNLAKLDILDSFLRGFLIWDKFKFVKIP